MNNDAEIVKEKEADLPPRRPRNADPISDAAGAHPIVTGVGTALGGAAAGFAAGVMAGPVGAVAGAIIGGVAGGFAGKGVGEWIDPTTDDPVLEAEFKNRKYVKRGETFETYKAIYQYGGQIASCNVDCSFADAESGIQAEYESTEASTVMPWAQARPAVQDAYERAQQIRRERAAHK